MSTMTMVEPVTTDYRSLWETERRRSESMERRLVALEMELRTHRTALIDATDNLHQTRAELLVVRARASKN